jgi:hypothetical protein
MMDLYLPRKTTTASGPPRPSFLRRNWRRARFVAGSPISTVGLPEIGDGRRVIGDLWGLLMRGPVFDGRLKTNADNSIDLRATAFCHGISVEQLIERLRLRQAQTRRASYVLFSLGSVSVLLWLFGALHMAMSRARLFSAAEFLPFCALFFLLAFKSAWMNWQIRRRRLGSVVAFLQTTEPFLPG